MAMETIKIDGQLIRVEDLSASMQNMTVLFEHIAQEETAARKQLALCEAARMELTRRMVTTYKNEQTEAAQAAEAGVSEDVVNITTDEESDNDSTSSD